MSREQATVIISPLHNNGSMNHEYSIQSRHISAWFWTTTLPSGRHRAVVHVLAPSLPQVPSFLDNQNTIDLIRGHAPVPVILDAILESDASEWPNHINTDAATILSAIERLALCDFVEIER